jgi:hypothetical protein
MRLLQLLLVGLGTGLWVVLGGAVVIAVDGPQTGVLAGWLLVAVAVAVPCWLRLGLNRVYAGQQAGPVRPGAWGTGGYLTFLLGLVFGVLLLGALLLSQVDLNIH